MCTKSESSTMNQQSSTIEGFFSMKKFLRIVID